jgi:2'-5' RNA ligase
LTTLFDSKLSSLDFKSAAEGADTGGIMIAMVPPKRIRKDLAVEDGEPVAAMHVTLAYLGSATEYTAKQRRDLHGLVEGWARTQKALTASVGGAGTFTNPGKHVLFAAVDIPGGGPFRESLVDVLEEHGYNVRNDHGWTPHITLDYPKHHVRFLPKVEPASWDVTEIHVCVGVHWEAVKLG